MSNWKSSTVPFLVRNFVNPGNSLCRIVPCLPMYTKVLGSPLDKYQQYAMSTPQTSDWCINLQSQYENIKLCHALKLMNVTDLDYENEL